MRNRQALVAERRAALALAEQSLADATLRAPFDGVVRERHLSIGGYLAVGAPVVTIVRKHPLRLRLAVPEREAGGVRVGQTRPTASRRGAARQPKGAWCASARRSTSTPARCSSRPRCRTTTARCGPGTFANAEIVVEPEQPAVLVPDVGGDTFAGVEKVLVVTDGRIVEQRVRIGRRDGDRVEILDGLAAGEPGGRAGQR